ncbi:hypothetical protein CFC21_067375 [Triticum aestivum]|uniref:Uncharacterized protein n=2 Tax=Triticum aestivum TaxID=4565 RepID=A0A3B6KNE6_WHEAT|nr:hypothetical protein CFC21_067375 [Triticum aestivum]
MALSCMSCPSVASGPSMRRHAESLPWSFAAFSFARCIGRSAAAASGWRIDAVAGNGGGWSLLDLLCSARVLILSVLLASPPR